MTAFDAAGLSSETIYMTIDMMAIPEWMELILMVAGGGDFPVGFGVEEGYFHVTFTYVPGTDPNSPPADSTGLFNFSHTLSPDMPLIGGKETSIEHRFDLDVAIPLSDAFGPKAEVMYRIIETLLGHQVSEIQLGAAAALTPAWELDSVSLWYSDEITLASFECKRTIVVGGIPLMLGIGADFFIGYLIELGAYDNLSTYYVTFEPTIATQINATVGIDLKFISIAVVISPRLTLGVNLGFTYPPPELDAGLVGYFQVGWSLRGCIWLFGCANLASGTIGPWQIIGDEAYFSGAAFEFAVSMPDHLVYPALDSGPSNELGLAWIRDLDPNPESVDPEVFFAFADSAGNWSPAMPVTGGGGSDGLLQTEPALAFGQEGDVIAVWVQCPDEEPPVLERQPTFSEGLDQQDIWWASWDGVTWTEPAPLHADPAGARKADGQPSVALSPSADEGLALWTHSVGDSALQVGSAEIYYSVYQGAKRRGWGAAVPLTSDVVDDTSPAVDYGTDGSALAAWVKRTGPGVDGEIVSSVWDGAAWSPHTTVSTPGRTVSDPSVARLPNGDGLAAWVSREIVGADSVFHYEVSVSRWDLATGMWDVPEEVYSDTLIVESTIVRSDLRNNACVTWRGHDGYDGDLFVSLKDMDDPASSWTSPRQITDDDLTDWMLAVDIDRQNNLHFVNLKTDLADTTGSPNRGGFFDGLSLSSKGIGADLGVGDELNYGFHPISADLRFGEVTRPDSLPVQGGALPVTAVVENIGEVVSPATTVLFTDGHPDSSGVAIGGPVTVDALYPGERDTVQATWTAAPGLHRIWAWVDPDGLVEEQTESNNRSFVPAGIYPDLTAHDIYAVSGNPVPGDSLTVFGVVRNEGGADSDPALVRLIATADSIADTLAVPVIAPLAPGDSTLVSGPWTAPAGTSTFALVVDPDSLIVEWDEADNVLERPFRVLPDLLVPVEFLAMTVTPDSTLAISASVVNAGGVAADSVLVRFYDGDPLGGGSVIADTTLVSMATFDTATVYLETGYRKGIVRLHAVVDEEETVDERDENNNRSHASFVFTLLSDLAITPTDIAVHGYQGPEIPFSIVAHVHNIGPADAAAPRVYFYDGHPDSAGVYIGGAIVASVRSDTFGVAEIEYEGVPDDGTEHSMYVWVDREEMIEELDEENNLAGRALNDAVSIPDQPVTYSTALLPITPNPFGERTEIIYTLAAPAHVRLQVFDVTGRLVVTLDDGRREPGRWPILWNGANARGDIVASGVYFVRLRAGEQRLQQKVVVLR